MTHCLVVDDSDVIRKIARSILESLGYTVTVAECGQHGIELCVSMAPDIVLVDWRMPGMSGLEFLGALRLASKACRPYVIYCLTDNDPTEIERAILGGAHDYLLKPFERAHLAAKLKAVADRASHTPRAAVPAAEHRAAAP